MILKRLSVAAAIAFVLAYLFKPGFKKSFWKLVLSFLHKKAPPRLTPPPPRKKTLPPVASAPVTAPVQAKPVQEVKQISPVKKQTEPTVTLVQQDTNDSIFPDYPFPEITTFTKNTLEEHLSSLPISISEHSHRYWAEREQARSLTQALYPLDKWSKMTEQNDVTISSLALDGFGLPFIRGDGLIRGSWSLLEVASVIQNNDSRKFWDPRFDSSDPLEWLNPDEVVGFSVQKGTFPVAARDLIVLLGSLFESDQKALIFTSSVEHVRGPKADSNGRVRAYLLIASWVLEKRPDGVYISYIVHVDPKGTVPSSLIKLVQTQTPMCIHGVRKYLESNGTLPFVIRGLGHHLSPSRDVLFQQYELTKAEISLIYTTHLDRTEKKSSSVDTEEEIKAGRVAVALPYNLYSTGVEIHLDLDCNSDDVECFSRVVEEQEYQRILSDACQFVVEFWLDASTLPNDEEVSVVVSIIPTKHAGVFVNGDRVDSL